ncbi:Ada metal-binding domain-containing protein [Chryseobacterium sp. OV279]|uniref:Ada metal-binding domain-containing protein n=1 Tax=Chryseobacterium sp. OV279 TaxID=1500285 RepID=UPI000916CE95|nr:Ada metal-binding domain-containing protein [Chryseobacterium sp. OV279]SHG08900.1 Metal binding domain of Ada [Chryseobacterium sp. OV279]
MENHTEITDSALRDKIRKREINFGGNRKLKIYGRLHCSSGKKMKRENRVFFRSEKEALENNYRPCGHCMKVEYKLWNNKSLKK